MTDLCWLGAEKVRRCLFYLRERVAIKGRPQAVNHDA